MNLDIDSWHHARNGKPNFNIYQSLYFWLHYLIFVSLTGSDLLICYKCSES